MEAKQHALSNQQIKKKLKKNRNMHRKNENENTTTENLWDSVKAVLRGWFIAIQAYLKKQEKNQINNLITPKATRKRRNEEPQGQYKEKNHKNQGRNK